MSMAAFGTSTPFTVGIEEELLLVEPTSLELAPVVQEILQALGQTTAIGGEVYSASLELRSAPRATVDEAIRDINAARVTATNAGATLAGVGVHPSGAHGDVALSPEPRYRRVAETVRGLVHRTPECALHIHVGMPDAETAIKVLNGLRLHLPLLAGLAANSPWWFGVDSNMASARAGLVRAYPGRGAPPWFADYDDYQSRVSEITSAADVTDYTYLWWDARLHPRLGTVEVREMDAQSSVAEVAALAALAQALAHYLADAEPSRPTPAEVLAWSSFRATRDGLEASIMADGALVSLRTVARCWLDRLRPYAREHGSEDALAGIERTVREGGGAARRRAAFGRGGLREMLDELVDETAGETQGLPSGVHQRIVTAAQ
jgi:glutamate---cysteine ligase / carboxylate-amine ligase